MQRDAAMVASPPRTIFRRILVPTDGSPAARAADAIAVRLAQAFGGCTRFISVIDAGRLASDFSMGTERDVGDIVARLKTIAGEVVDEARERAAFAGVASEAALLEGNVVDRILEDAVGWRADVIVIGTNARHEAFHPALGSKAHELLRRSTLPVLVCR